MTTTCPDCNDGQSNSRTYHSNDGPFSAPVSTNGATGPVRCSAQIKV